VIAQGVETEEQKDRLVQAGPETWAQGFHFSGAVSATEAAQLLRAGRITSTGDATASQTLATGTGR
jgi:sensor c-di-GMP phosphodiesterase-like protein